MNLQKYLQCSSIKHKRPKIVLAVHLLVFSTMSSLYLTPLLAITSTPIKGQTNCRGVTKNSDGMYSFARLHVDTNGILVDDKGSEVYLLGAEGKDAGITHTGTYSVSKLEDFKYIARLNQKAPINLLRVPIWDNAWVKKTLVPGANMNYQDFVKAYVKAIEG